RTLVPRRCAPYARGAPPVSSASGVRSRSTSAGSPAPAGNAGGVVDVLEARPGRGCRVHRRPEGGCGAGLHAPLAARAGRGSLSALRYADDRQGRDPAVLTSGGPNTAPRGDTLRGVRELPVTSDEKGTLSVARRRKR